MRTRVIAAGTLALALLGLAAAWQFGHLAQAPYAGLQTREISTLSATDMADLREGRGMGYALAAELNGYPGPRHVLDMAKKLALTPEQQQRTQALFDSMKQETSGLGLRLIEAERKLSGLFASRLASPEAIRTLTGEASLIEGQLRAAHLKYHVAMLDVMTPEQLQSYASLRGYGADHHATH